MGVVIRAKCESCEMYREVTSIVIDKYTMYLKLDCGHNYVVVGMIGATATPI